MDNHDEEHTVALQAGLRSLHAFGPEIRRAISGNLDEDNFESGPDWEPMHRRNHTLFGNVLSSFGNAKLKRAPATFHQSDGKGDEFVFSRGSSLCQLQCSCYMTPSSPQFIQINSKMAALKGMSCTGECVRPF